MLFCALERPIRDVFVAGRRVVEDGRVTTIDLGPEIEELNAAQLRALSVVHEKDWAGRTGDEAFPRSLPLQ
jgi:hypothetical protein